jgi:hypothetical protein
VAQLINMVNKTHWTLLTSIQKGFRLNNNYSLKVKKSNNKFIHRAQ